MQKQTTFGGREQRIGGIDLPFCRGVRAGDFVYTSGQVPIDENNRLVGGDIEQQTHQVMKNIVTILSELGCTMDDVIKCNAWLDDPRDFAKFNEVYGSYFTGTHRPARSAVQSTLMCDAKVEVEAVAYRPLNKD